MGSRFIRLLLRAYPRDFRAEYGAEMQAAFAECIARERLRRPATAPIVAPLKAIFDTLRYARAMRAVTVRPQGSRMHQILQDLRFATRVLAKDRSFTATVLLTLAICIGANAAIFAIVRSVLLNPLPVPEPARLVSIYNSYPNAGIARSSSGVPDYYDRMRETDVFEELALYRRSGVTLGVDGSVERVQAVSATPSLLRILRVQPALGRTFTEEDGQPGNELKVILSHGTWQTRFGGRPDVLGRQLRIFGREYEIVGVMPPGFQFIWSDVTLWRPLAFKPEDKADDRRHSNNYEMIGRLKPGASVDQAQQQIDALNKRNDERFPNLAPLLKDAGFRTYARSTQADLVRDVRPTLYLLWGGALFVLLIGAVNITNLVIVRSSARQRELATRHAIGAGLNRLASQLVTETMLLSLVGGLLGLALGRLALEFVPALGFDEMPRGHEIAMAPATMALVLGGALLVGLLVSLVPVMRVWRLNLNLALRDEGRGGTAGRSSMLMRRALATAQVGLAFLLLLGAGLLFASFRQVLRVDPGFSAEGVISGLVALPAARYPDDAQLPVFYQRSLERIRAIPGVESAAITDTLPFGEGFSDSVILAEGYVMKPGESLVSPTSNHVSAGYFETMKIRLLKGRFFSESDVRGGQRVVIVDKKLANKFWPDRDPVGRRMFQTRSVDEGDITKPGPNSVFFTVVGVVDDVTMFGLADEDRRVGAVYYPAMQTLPAQFAFVARTSLDPEPIVAAMRREISVIDPELPFYDVQPMTQRIDESLVARRMPMLLAMAFGTVALFLSAIGIYGVLAYQVAQRRREIGIRMALGSTMSAVFGLVVRDGARIVAIGLAAGLAGAFATAKYIETQLFGIEPLDPMVIAGVALLLGVVSFLAVAIPARRAARVNPMVALNH